MATGFVPNASPTFAEDVNGNLAVVLNGGQVAPIVTATPSGPGNAKTARTTPRNLYSVDSRRLAKWHSRRTVALPLTVVWSGDSTTWQMSTSNVTYVGTAWTPKAASPELADEDLRMLNRGFNGASMASLTTAGPMLNSDNVDCSMGTVAALAADAYVFCLGLNDGRADASIAGSTYGNAAQLSKVAELRGYIAQWYAAIKSANPNAVIVWRVPNAHKSASATYLQNGVTGQNLMDVMRLTYLGDPALGLDSLENLYADTICYDVMGRLYGYSVVSNSATTWLLHSDGFHPSAQAYNLIVMGVLRLLVGQEPGSIFTASDVQRTRALEAALAHSAHSPREPLEITNSGLYALVATGYVSASLNNQFSIAVDALYPGAAAASGAQALWGASAGAYGSSAVPLLHRGDLLVFDPVDGNAPLVERIANIPSDINGVALRWFSANTPNGRYLNTLIPQGTRYRIYRNRFCGSSAAQLLDKLRTDAFTKPSALKNAYRYSITGATANTVTLLAMPVIDDFAGDSAAHTITTSDVLCIPGKWGTANAAGGIELTGATFAAGANTGETVVTLTGFDFTGAHIAQAVVFSNT